MGSTVVAHWRATPKSRKTPVATPARIGVAEGRAGASLQEDGTHVEYVRDDAAPQGAASGPLVEHERVVDAQSCRAERLEGVVQGEGDALQGGPHEVALGVVEREAEDHAARVGVPDGRPLPHQVGQEEQPIAARRDCGSLLEQQVVGADARGALGLQLGRGELVAQVAQRAAARGRGGHRDPGVLGVHGVGEVDRGRTGCREEEVAVAVDDAEVPGRTQVHLDVAGFDRAALQPAGIAVDLATSDGCARHETTVGGRLRRDLADDVLAGTEVGQERRINAHGLEEVRVEAAAEDVVGAVERCRRVVHGGPTCEPEADVAIDGQDRRDAAEVLRAMVTLPEQVDESGMVLEAVGGDVEDALRADVLLEPGHLGRGAAVHEVVGARQRGAGGVDEDDGGQRRRDGHAADLRGRHPRLRDRLAGQAAEDLPVARGVVLRPAGMVRVDGVLLEGVAQLLPGVADQGDLGASGPEVSTQQEVHRVAASVERRGLRAPPVPAWSPYPPVSRLHAPRIAPLQRRDRSRAWEESQN